MATRGAVIEPVAGNKLVQVSLPPDMIEAIDALADKSRVKRGTMVRTILAQYLDDLKAQAA